MHIQFKKSFCQCTCIPPTTVRLSMSWHIVSLSCLTVIFSITVLLCSFTLKRVLGHGIPFETDHESIHFLCVIWWSGTVRFGREFNLIRFVSAPPVSQYSSFQVLKCRLPGNALLQWNLKKLQFHLENLFIVVVQTQDTALGNKMEHSNC